MAGKKKKAPYPFTEQVQKALATMLADRPRLFARVGEDLDADSFSFEPAKHAVRAIRVIAHELGAPNNQIPVIQRLRTWMEDGQLTQEDVNAVVDMFDSAEDAGLPDEEALVGEVAPVLRRRARDKAVKHAIDQLPQNESLADVADELKRAEQIGESRGATAIGWGQMRSTLVQEGSFVRLPTGIMELDRKLEGGFERGSLWTWLGLSGGGKSIALTQVAANALLSGINVCYATLELSKGKTAARLIANLSGVPLNRVLNGQMDVALEQLTRLPLAKIHLDYFTPKVTTIGHIKDYVKSAEDRHGEKFEMVIVDYGDKLTAKSGNETSSYVEGGNVWEEYRVWMEAEQRWGVTAAQARRQDKKQKQVHLTLDDFADSMGKPRVTDGALALNRLEHETEVRIGCMKNRNGESGWEVGPMPTAFQYGRLTTVDRDREALPGTQMEMRHEADLWA
jgi:replicative DNA helicase